MGTRNQLWSIAKMSVTGGVIGITISDRYVTVVAIKGHSMHPTMTATDSALRGICGFGFYRSVQAWRVGLSCNPYSMILC